MNHSTDARGRLIMDDDTWAFVRATNHNGNALSGEEAALDIAPRWQPTDDLERCDLVTLWKMHELIKAGVSATPQLFTLCRDADGHPHGVLCLLTTEGDFVLDAHRETIATLDEVRALGYRIEYRSSIGKTLDDVIERIKEYRTP